MTTLQDMLVGRREEYETHFALALALQDRIFIGDDISFGEVDLSIRHLRTMQSGLVVHLYNVVEATMTRVTEMLGHAVGACTPRTWSTSALREWLRAVVPADGGEDTRLERVHSASLQLLMETPPGPPSFKKPPGTWDDKLIVKFAARLGVPFQPSRELRRLMAPQPRYGDKTPLGFLADRRNVIAHGQRSFEDGCKDLTLGDIRELADAILDYLVHTAGAFQNYIDGRLFMNAKP